MPLHYAVTGLQFGDEGKGSVVDFLVRERQAKTVVRFNGSSQAAHHVVLPNGTTHVFSQFSSGTFSPGVKTYLSEHVLVDPLSMIMEGNHLIGIGQLDCWERIHVSKDALIVTPYHRAVNRIKEKLSGEGRHGSCGLGIGEVMRDTINNPELCVRVHDCLDLATILDKLRRVQESRIRYYYRPMENDDIKQDLDILGDLISPDEFAQRFYDWSSKIQIEDEDFPTKILRDEVVIFEGAQGVLLDEWYGFHPNTTWSTTTFENVDKLLKKYNSPNEVLKVGVSRCYNVRHGPGVFPTEEIELKDKLKEDHNKFNMWQGDVRVGWLDLVLLDYAYKVCGQVDKMIWTCLDKIKELSEIKVCSRYLYRDFRVDRIIVNRDKDLTRQSEIREKLDRAVPEYTNINFDDLLCLLRSGPIPNWFNSYGPTYQDKKHI